MKNQKGLSGIIVIIFLLICMSLAGYALNWSWDKWQEEKYPVTNPTGATTTDIIFDTDTLYLATSTDCTLCPETEYQCPPCEESYPIECDCFCPPCSDKEVIKLQNQVDGLKSANIECVKYQRKINDEVTDLKQKIFEQTYSFKEQLEICNN